MNLFMVNVAPAGFGEMQIVLENGKRMINLDSTFFAGHLWVGHACMRLGRPQEGSAAYQLITQLDKGPLGLSILGVGYGLMGDKLKALDVIKQMESMEGIQRAPNNWIGDVYVSMGELDRAFGYYEKAVDAREELMLWKKIFVLGTPELQHDPRTKKLLDRIGVHY
jgi:adenylate cyclase